MAYTRQLKELGAEELDLAGGKGANLGELSRAGLPVPPGFVITTEGYRAFVQANDLQDTIVRLAAGASTGEPTDFERIAEEIRSLFARGQMPDAVAVEIRDAYAGLAPNTERAVGVRSSATAEDLAGASFAGQQETYLNVRGLTALTEAIRDCWSSLWTARAIAYRARQAIDPSTVSLAVVVQEMVEAEASGVMFTANPANGRRDQAAISASWGLGESVVSGSVTPDALVVDKATRRVLSRETASKDLMTVYSENGTVERPVPPSQRDEPVLSDDQAADLAGLATRIEAHYGRPQDIEWALADGGLYVLQSRPITALPESASDPPTDWTVPYPRGVYYRASIVEQMPDPLSPLFADLAEASIPRSLYKLFEELLGRRTFRAGDLAFPTINGYAYYYFSLGVFRRLLVRSPAALRTLSGTGQRSGMRRWRERSHPLYARIVERSVAKVPSELSAKALLVEAWELLDAGAEYYTSVQTVIPLAASSEILFTIFYDRLVRRRGDPPPQTFLLGFDSQPIRAEKSLYDLGVWTRGRPHLAEALERTSSDAALDFVRTEEPPSRVEAATWDEWRSRFGSHLNRYGHMVYSLDFLNPVPADAPGPPFDTLKHYLRGAGENPHERQARSRERREQATEATLERLDGPRRRVFRRLLEWAQKAAPVREDALADVGLAWPVMRRLLLELGHRFTEAEAIEQPTDVFWLRREEVESMAASLDAGVVQLGRTSDAVYERRMTWRGQRRAVPPQSLPEDSWLGSKAFERFMPAASTQQTGDTIRGVGASQGKVAAPARVLSGPADFGQMKPGEVLVASITTPAWTSLFATASAVVTDVGGPLSHSSIVAREYGIPAVLGTGVATHRISSGQTIRVDGDNGTVTLLNDAARPG